jgi:Resolvase, N terminal domain
MCPQPAPGRSLPGIETTITRNVGRNPPGCPSYSSRRGEAHRRPTSPSCRSCCSVSPTNSASAAGATIRPRRPLHHRGETPTHGAGRGAVWRPAPRRAPAPPSGLSMPAIMPVAARRAARACDRSKARVRSISGCARKGCGQNVVHDIIGRQTSRRRAAMHPARADPGFSRSGRARLSLSWQQPRGSAPAARLLARIRKSPAEPVRGGRAPRVGAVLAIEASRLARNGRDWHTLIEFCGLVGTIIVDEDGMYDPRHPNDRLLLGMKGTMSELELSLFRQRSQEALKLAVERR